VALDLLAVVPLLTWPALAKERGATPPPLAVGRPLPPLQRLRLHNCVVHRIRHFLEREGYVEIPVPTLTPATGSCEFVDSMFTVDYFGTLAFPRQTGQLYLEEFVARGMDAVYCEGQSLRKEGRVDGRHLTEFKLIEIEKRDMTLEALCDVQERLVKDVALHVSADEIGGAHVTRLDWMARWEHPRLTYREAIDLLRRHGFALSFGDPLDHEAEVALVRYCGNLPVHVTHFPESIKFFNMKLDRVDPSVVECVDYILPYAGETFGGSLREPDTGTLRRRLLGGSMYGHLMDRASEFAHQQWAAGLVEGESAPDLAARHCRGIEQAFASYLALFEEEPVERAGFGLGVARLLQFLTGLESVKDAVVFPMDRSGFGASVVAVE
jgi:asparaginyl-tRNA synthetase